MRISRARLGSNNLLDTLKRKGYATYGNSANLFVTPQFGFVFDRYKLFNQAGELKESPGPAGSPVFQRFMPLLLQRGTLGSFLRWLAFDAIGRLLKAIGVQKLEKGSKHILSAVSSTQFEQPFFAFFNLMEAHQPYVWWILDTLIVRLSLLGMPPRASWWKQVYPRHSALAVSRGVELASKLMKHDPLIIVTSDHGQLLGDDGRYGHGFSLDEALLRVPLFVRFPGGRNWLQLEGPVISLAEIPKMVQKAAEGDTCRIGAEYAVAESWGEDNYRTGEFTEDGEMHRIFLGRVGSGRVRIVAKKGSVLVNRETGAVEEVSGDLTAAEIQELSTKVPKVAMPEPTRPGSGFASTDEELVLGRLKQLGYE